MYSCTTGPATRRTARHDEPTVPFLQHFPNAPTRKAEVVGYRFGLLDSNYKSRLSGFKAQQNTNQPLSASETTFHAANRACVAAPSADPAPDASKATIPPRFRAGCHCGCHWPLARQCLSSDVGCAGAIPMYIGKRSAAMSEACRSMPTPISNWSI